MVDEARIDEAVQCGSCSAVHAHAHARGRWWLLDERPRTPRVFSSGDTAEEAMELLDEAIAMWVEVEVEDGHDIPPPSRAVEYSGRLTLRLLPSIHERAALLAEHEGASLNRYLANAISYYVGLGSPQASPAPSARARPALMAVREEPGTWSNTVTSD